MAAHETRPHFDGPGRKGQCLLVAPGEIMSDARGTDENRVLGIARAEPKGLFKIRDGLFGPSAERKPQSTPTERGSEVGVQVDRSRERSGGFVRIPVDHGQIAQADMSPGIEVIDLDGATRRRERRLARFIGQNPSHMGGEQQLESERAVGRSVFRVQGDRLFEHTDRSLRFRLGHFPVVGAGTHHQVPGVQVLTRAAIGIHRLRRH